MKVGTFSSVDIPVCQRSVHNLMGWLRVNLGRAKPGEITRHEGAQKIFAKRVKQSGFTTITTMNRMIYLFHLRSETERETPAKHKRILPTRSRR